MTVHKMAAETDYCPDDVCGTSFDIRTNQPGWEGGDQYLVNVTLDGQDLYGGAGQNNSWHVDPDFAGVRAGANTSSPLAPGAHTLVLDWLYRGTWMCGTGVPNGCSYVGREHVTKTYKFRWYGTADQTVRPYRVPASSISIAAKRSAANVIVTGAVRSQRLNSNFVPGSNFYPVRAARVTLQSYSASTGKWVSRKTASTNTQGRATATIRAPRRLKWRFTVATAGDSYAASTSRTVAK